MKRTKNKTNKRSCKALYLTLYLLFCILTLVGTYYGQVYLRLAKMHHINIENARDSVRTRASSLASHTLYHAQRIPFDSTNESTRRDYLERLEVRPFLSGGYYLMDADGQIEATSDLPTGCLNMDFTVYWDNEEAFFSPPYIRATDKLSVITIYQTLSDGWRVAADIPATYFAEYFAQDASTEHFYYLLDRHTGKFLTAPHKSLLGLQPADIDNPLFPSRALQVNLNRIDMHSLQDADGRKLYWSNTSCGDWILVYYQTPDSLYEDAMGQPWREYMRYRSGNPDFVAWPGLLLTSLLLVILGIFLFLPKPRIRELLESQLEPLIPGRSPFSQNQK